MTLLAVRELSKSYKTYASEWHRIARWLGASVQPASETTVLHTVSFSVKAGEAVGIVGENGAGKSTLLKLIAGTLIPSSGHIHVDGRVSAILELGMGFNPDMTGRQNVYHAASIMGFSQSAVDTVIDQIELFAEVDKYFDQPVRLYSSGMQVRVAFAVATAWRPEMLIVDEALSVGDTYFQHKSFARIREFQQQGTSLLIVSHDRACIQALCDRAILLEQGRVLKDDEPEAVMDFYNALIAERENTTTEVHHSSTGKAQTVSGTGEARVCDIRLCAPDGTALSHVKVGEPVQLVVRVKITQPIISLVLGFGIRDRLGQMIYGSNTFHTEQVLTQPEVGREYCFTIAFNANLGVGSYSVVTALHADDSHIEHNYEWRDLALIFDVINADKTTFQGCAWLDTEITYE